MRGKKADARMYPGVIFDVFLVNARSHDLDVMSLKNRSDDVLY